MPRRSAVVAPGFALTLGRSIFGGAAFAKAKRLGMVRRAAPALRSGASATRRRRSTSWASGCQSSGDRSFSTSDRSMLQVDRRDRAMPAATTLTRHAPAQGAARSEVAEIATGLARRGAHGTQPDRRRLIATDDRQRGRHSAASPLRPVLAADDRRPSGFGSLILVSRSWWILENPGGRRP